MNRETKKEKAAGVAFRLGERSFCVVESVAGRRVYALKIQRTQVERRNKKTLPRNEELTSPLCMV